jgi:hypothetical protein
MSQPERDHGAIHAVVKKVHGCGMPTDMWGDTLPIERRATSCGQMDVFSHEAFDRIATESAAADAGKDRIFGLAVAFA